MVIRNYTTEDKDALISALYQFQTYLAELDPLKRIQCQPGFGEAYLEDVLKKVAQHQGTILVVEENKKVIGFATGYIEELSKYEQLAHIPIVSGYIPDVYVDPEFRGSGIGKQLMEKMEQYFKEKKCTMISFRVLRSNETAHEFYKTLGYEDREYIMEKMI